MRIIVVVALLMLLAACSPQSASTSTTTTARSTSSPSATPLAPAPGASTIAKPVEAGWSPDKACGFIGSDFGVAVRPYHRLGSYDETYGCATSYKTLGSGYPLANNLAYYVSGNSSVATEVKLSLNVNVRSQQDNAKGQLKKFAKVVAKTATGAKLPTALARAISSGTPKAITVNGYTQELKRDDWPTGKGYELQYIVTKVSKG